MLILLKNIALNATLRPKNENKFILNNRRVKISAQKLPLILKLLITIKITRKITMVARHSPPVYRIPAAPPIVQHHHPVQNNAPIPVEPGIQVNPNGQIVLTNGHHSPHNHLTTTQLILLAAADSIVRQAALVAGDRARIRAGKLPVKRRLRFPFGNQNNDQNHRCGNDDDHNPPRGGMVPIR